ncbi:MAG: methylated-DNA--[protein]-cysteine S-methyltransferase [Clostridia bacterium]|nr:methylated-DNA--[protein]-cysteine S-methyltransferase [Clostridia bacterium]
MSPLGGITEASDGENLVGLWFDGQDHFAYSLNADHEEKPLQIFDLTDRWLDVYFGGSAPDFTPPLLIRATPFRKEVYRILQTVPYGCTTTYGKLAKAVAGSLGFERTSARAVGNAVGHNPISLIIPCHRVVGSDGSLTGYAGGLDRKRRLLETERSLTNAPDNMTL